MVTVVGLLRNWNVVEASYRLLGGEISLQLGGFIINLEH